MTILMSSDKSLSITVKSNIYQRDNLVDNLIFLIPSVYNDIDLTDFDVILKYKDQNDNVDSELLVKDEELYKEKYIRCVLPVNNKLSTRYSGDIHIRLVLNKIDLETQTEYSLNSGETSFSILPVSDYYEKFESNPNFTIIEQKMNELNVKIKALDKMAAAYDEEKADGIKLNTDDSTIYLTSGNKQIGQKISVEELSEEIVNSSKDGLISVIL